MSEEFLSRLDKQAREWAEGRDRTKRVGFWMIVFLAVGTIVEYLIAVTVDRNVPIMVAINLAEAAAILWFFMHVRRVWGGGEH
jgi:hypothetical protein